MKRGTIVLTKFPFTDLTSAKRRPGVVVSGKSSHKDDVIIAFISSLIPEHTENTEYILNTDQKDFSMTGLKKDSVIKLDKLATINTSIISGEIGRISDSILIEIDECLKVALGLK